MKIKKITSIFLAIVVSLPMFGIVSKADANIIKLSGKNRIQTSIATSNLVNSDKVVFSSAYNFADSLSAFNLAYSKKAKLVLIDNKADITNILSGKKEAYIIGGENLINASTESKIKNAISNTVRVAGRNRYDTNKKSLEIAGFENVGVADGRNYPDALSASGLLADKNMGLMLVDGSKNYSTSYNVKYTFGGKNSVLKDGGERIAGRNRYETSKLINRKIEELNTIVYTSGANYADALSAINLVNKSPKTGVLLLNYINDKNKAGFVNVANQYSVGNMIYKKAAPIQKDKSGMIKLSSYNPSKKEVDNVILNAIHSGDFNVKFIGNTKNYYRSSGYLSDILYGMLYGECTFSGKDYSKKYTEFKIDPLGALYVNIGEIKPDKYREHQERLQEIIDAAGVKPGDSTRNKVILVAKYLKHNYKYYNEYYDEYYLKGKKAPEEVERNAVSPFTLTDFKESICSGFTGVFNQIMFKLGIPSYTLEGSASWSRTYDKNGKRVYVVDHANPCVYYNKEWHELNVTGYPKKDTDAKSKACADLFEDKVVDTPEVREQKEKFKMIYSEYRDFYLRVNPDLEKIDNSEDSRFDTEDRYGIYTYTDENGVKTFSSQKEMRDYMEKKVKELREKFKVGKEDREKIKNEYEKEIIKRREEYEKKKREADENIRRLRNTQIDTQDYDHDGYINSLITEINRKRQARGMSTLQIDSIMSGYLDKYCREEMNGIYNSDYVLERVLGDDFSSRTVIDMYGNSGFLKKVNYLIEGIRDVIYNPAYTNIAVGIYGRSVKIGEYDKYDSHIKIYFYGPKKSSNTSNRSEVNRTTEETKNNSDASENKASDRQSSSRQVEKDSSETNNAGGNSGANSENGGAVLTQQ